MKKLLIITISLMWAIWSISAQAKHKHLESYYVKQNCQGVQEYVLSDNTRIDCFSDFAEEWDYASQKWYECISQSLHYSMLTGRPAKCVLIKESEADQKYIDRAAKLIEYYKLPVILDTLQSP
jgi:hypothetical protein